MSQLIMFSYASLFGELTLGSYKEQLCLCDWTNRKARKTIDRRIASALNAEWTKGKTGVIDNAIRQLEEYAKKQRTTFNLPLLKVGTGFQRSVWDQLLRIPYGQTMSYLELSKELGDVKAIRAVAAANGANALSIFIPCHRIIGSDGSLTGYAGGLPAKNKLLELEGSISHQQLLFKE